MSRKRHWQKGPLLPDISNISDPFTLHYNLYKEHPIVVTISILFSLKKGVVQKWKYELVPSIEGERGSVLWVLQVIVEKQICPVQLVIEEFNLFLVIHDDYTVYLQLLQIINISELSNLQAYQFLPKKYYKYV